MILLKDVEKTNQKFKTEIIILYRSLEKLKATADYSDYKTIFDFAKVTIDNKSISISASLEYLEGYLKQLETTALSFPNKNFNLQLKKQVKQYL